MRRMSAVAAGLCLAGGLTDPALAHAEPEPPDCPQTAQKSLQIMQGVLQSPSGPNPRAAAKFTPVVFTPDADGPDGPGSTSKPELNVTLRIEGCWEQPQAARTPDGSQILQFQRGSGGTVSVAAEMSAERRDLGDVLAYDRRQQLAASQGSQGPGSASQTEVLENDEDDYQGNPSWILRARTTTRERDGRELVFETTTREIAVAGRDHTYLVTATGTAASWTEPGEPVASADLDSADAVCDQVKTGLAVSTNS